MANGRMSRVVNLPKLNQAKIDDWVNDEDRFSCHICNKRFSMFRRKHHCRACGEIICGKCSLYHRIKKGENATRVCVSCAAFHSVDSPKNLTTTNASAVEEWANAWPEPPYPDNESDRLQTLRQLNILSIAKEGVFDMFCDVAARSLKCPISAVSIIEDEDQILLANIGLSQESLPRELSFDAYTICENRPFIVLDTKNDERFKNNPMVRGAVKIRFYAGVTIFSPNRYALGTISVYDTKPRKTIESENILILKNLSSLVAEKMNRNYVPYEEPFYPIQEINEDNESFDNGTRELSV